MMKAARLLLCRRRRNALQPFMLDLDGLRQEAVGAGLQVAEFRRLDPAVEEHEGEHRHTVVALDDLAALANARALADVLREEEGRAPPVEPALVLLAAVDAALDG